MTAFFFTACLLICTTAAAAVWDTEHQWSDQWEGKYAQWVKEHWRPEIFTSPASPYHGISTDCADASYDMRLIFAHESRLPFVINNPESPGGVISNDLNRWDSRPQPERLREFIEYVNDVTSSQTMPEDTYPVAITRRALTPGIIYVQPGEHSYQIVAVDAYGVTDTMFSTMPRAVRELLFEPNFPIFVPSDMLHYRDGYRRFRWPQYLKLPETEVPGFSDEQYRLARSVAFDYARFTDLLMRRLGRKPEPAPLRVRRFMYNLCYVARNRVEFIERATAYRATLPAGRRTCLTGADYENYSTDNRDKRLKKSFEYVRDLIGSRYWTDPDWAQPQFRPERYLKPYAEAIFNIGDTGAPRMQPREAAASGTGGDGAGQQTGDVRSNAYWYLARQPATRFRTARDVTNGDLIAWCGIEYSPGKTISLRDLWRSITDNALSPDPNETLESRWGLVAPRRPTGCPRH